MRVEQRVHEPEVNPHLRPRDLLVAVAAGVVIGAVLDNGFGQAVVPLLMGGGLLTVAVLGSMWPSGTASASPMAGDGVVPGMPLAAPATDWWRHFALEFERSRRYDHPRALVALGVPRGSDPELVLGRVATHLRRLDTAWLDGIRILVLLPEADRTKAESLVSRLLASEPDHVRLEDVRIAAFPEDALTSAALLDRVAQPGMLALETVAVAYRLPERMRRAAHMARDESGPRARDPVS